MMENFNKENIFGDQDKLRLDKIKERLNEINPTIQNLESLVSYGTYLRDEKISIATTDPLDVKLIESLDSDESLLIDLQIEKESLERERDNLLRKKGDNISN